MSDPIADIDTYNRWSTGSVLDEDYPTTSEAIDAQQRVFAFAATANARIQELQRNNGEITAEFCKQLDEANAESAVAFITTMFGKRCKSKDTDEYTSEELTNVDGSFSRCPVCEIWDTYDEWVAQKS